MEDQKINEDCGCTGSSSEYNPRPIGAYPHPDPNLGKMATLADGRSGTINDSIRNSNGEVIGYVMNNERGSFRVFKDKVTNIYESGEAMASLDSTPGMGDIQAPTRTSPGSGDQFPSLTAGTPAAKGKKKSSKEDEEDKPSNKLLMSWNDFRKKMTKLQ
jgi:hypothetical protein